MFTFAYIYRVIYLFLAGEVLGRENVFGEHPPRIYKCLGSVDDISLFCIWLTFR